MHWYWWLLIGFGAVLGLFLFAFIWCVNSIGNPK
jgi:hypothetical protein